MRVFARHWHEKCKLTKKKLEINFYIHALSSEVQMFLFFWKIVPQRCPSESTACEGVLVGKIFDFVPATGCY